jgi:prepilin-type N-terminal cleavage/methylation domain-containing protein
MEKNNDRKKISSGFTLIELIVSIFIFLIVVIGSTTLFTDTINTSNSLTGNLNAQMDVRKAFNSMSDLIRSASQSSNGAYPIDTASSTYFAYYSDIDKDGIKEKIRYFLSGKTLKIGVIDPTGSPLTYNPGNEKISTLINDVVNPPAVPIFSYYDNTYNGTSSPMAMPINVPAVRLIKINVLIDHDTRKPPAAIGFTTQVSIRNLKDN